MRVLDFDYDLSLNDETVRSSTPNFAFTGGKDRGYLFCKREVKTGALMGGTYSNLAKGRIWRVNKKERAGSEEGRWASLGRECKITGEEPSVVDVLEETLREDFKSYATPVSTELTS